MRRSFLIVPVILLAGCQHYYQVQDPKSGQIYFTDKWVAADGYRGPLHFTDSKGQHVDLRVAQVNRISHDDYLDATLKTETTP